MQSPIFYSLDDPRPLIDYLQNQNWITSEEHVQRVTKAGEGNMNFVARIHTNERTLIFKQSRPWVEKYPQIEAPIERIESEVAFYKSIKSFEDLSAGMPALLAFDNQARCALFEDLGDVEDYANIYDGNLASVDELQALIHWLSTLHNTSFPSNFKANLSNRSMRRLNYAHLFDIPLQRDNGLSLDEITPGLQQAAETLKNNNAYTNIIRELGKRYLEDGDTLLHGDFYPGSWVRTPHGPRVIDPEFGFFGLAEYDLGVCLAHLLMAGYSPEGIRKIMSVYKKSKGLNMVLAHQFAGMEIMRRLIGVAQLSIHRNIDEKASLLTYSMQLVLNKEAPQLL